MRIAAFTAAACLLAGVVSGQTVTYDFDRSADFSRFRSYAWAPGTPAGDQLTDRRIVAAIESELASRGINPSGGEAPDLLVSYYVSFDQELEVNGWAVGPYRVGALRSGSARVQEVLLGTLAVQIVNAKTGAIVWRSMATKEIDTKASPAKRDRNVRAAVEKLFKQYPARKEARGEAR